MLTHLDHCTNCDRSLDTQINYCPNCGQKNIDRKVSVWTFLKEILQTFFKVDSRTFRTLFTFLRKPGYLTNAFIQGRRMRYLSPFRLFLSMGVLCLLVFTAWINIDESGKLNKEPAFDIRFTNVESMDTTGIIGIIRSGLEHAKKDPIAYQNNLLKKIPIGILFLLPLFGIIMKWMYLRTNFLWVEHLAFLFHFNAFVFATCLVVILGLWLSIVEAILYPFALISIMTYLFISQKEVYKESWGWTFLKGFTVFAIYLLIVPMGSILISLVLGIFF